MKHCLHAKTTSCAGRFGEVTDIKADIAGNWFDTTLAEQIRYQPFGPVKQLTWGNGLTLTRSFDQDGRIRRQQIPGVQDLDYGFDASSYGFDASSNITRISDGIAALYSVTYDYDALDRLITDNSGKAEHRYRYDAIGNRLEKTAAEVSADSGTGPAQTESYHYASDSNRLATRNGTAYQYDANGNTINDGDHRYQYDVTNRMLSAQTASGAELAQYRYNALGQRSSKTLTQNGHTTVFAYDPAGKLLSEATLDANRNVIARKHYVWLGIQPIAQIEPAANDSDYQVLYLHADHLNTPRKATNAEQTVVWQWKGEAFGASAANDDPDGDGVVADIALRFPGQYFDRETGKHYNYFRDYDPGLGRYIQSDPIGLAGGINTYLYVDNRVLSSVDFYGLRTFRIGNSQFNIGEPSVGIITIKPSLDVNSNGSVEGGGIGFELRRRSQEKPNSNIPQFSPRQDGIRETVNDIVRDQIVKEINKQVDNSSLSEEEKKRLKDEIKKNKDDLICP